MNTFPQTIPLDERSLNAVTGGTFQPLDPAPETGADAVNPLAMGGDVPDWTPINLFPCKVISSNTTGADSGNA